MRFFCHLKSWEGGGGGGGVRGGKRGKRGDKGGWLEERRNLGSNVVPRPSISPEVCKDCILQLGRVICEIFGLKPWLFGEGRSNYIDDW